jgi:apolipoprotein N-acyltransferase
VIVLVLAFGTVRLALAPPQGREVKVGLVASDLPAYSSVADPGAPAERELRDYAARAEVLAAGGAQVIVLPEHLAEANSPDIANADGLFQALADKTGSTIVVGLGHVSPQVQYNEARIYAPGTQVRSYDKHHLLPPFESKYTPGNTLTTLTKPKGSWGVAICKDMDFTQLSRGYGIAGTSLLLVPGWDFQIDRLHHGHMALMRGVESGFSIAHAARGGYLTVSDNRGRVLAETQSDSAPFATLVADVPAVHDNTIYLLLGDWFAWLTLAILAFTLMQLIRIPRTQTH